MWNREKLALQKSLKRAEAEVYKLKAELRNEALLQNLSPDSEHAAIKVGDILQPRPFSRSSSSETSRSYSLPPPSQSDSRGMGSLVRASLLKVWSLDRRQGCHLAIC